MESAGPALQKRAPTAPFAPKRVMRPTGSRDAKRGRSRVSEVSMREAYLPFARQTASRVARGGRPGVWGVVMRGAPLPSARRLLVAACLSPPPLPALQARGDAPVAPAVADVPAVAPGRYVWRDDGSASGPVR